MRYFKHNKVLENCEQEMENVSDERVHMSNSLR